MVILYSNLIHKCDYWGDGHVPVRLSANSRVYSFEYCAFEMHPYPISQQHRICIVRVYNVLGTFDSGLF